MKLTELTNYRDRLHKHHPRRIQITYLLNYHKTSRLKLGVLSVLLLCFLVYVFVDILGHVG